MRKPILSSRFSLNQGPVFEDAHFVLKVRRRTGENTLSMTLVERMCLFGNTCGRAFQKPDAPSAMASFGLPADHVLGPGHGSRRDTRCSPVKPRQHAAGEGFVFRVARNRAIRGTLTVGHTSLLQMIWLLSEGYAPFLSFLQSTKFYSTPGTDGEMFTRLGACMVACARRMPRPYAKIHFRRKSGGCKEYPRGRQLV
jgi:hypothetical protein